MVEKAIEAFQTARFEVHNPSRHKQAMLLSAMCSYHQMTKEILERALADPDALQQNCLGRPNAKGQSQPNGFVTSKYVRSLTRKGWNLAPLRDYALADVTAALMSYLQKNHKGKNKANPPTLPVLQAISEQEYRQAYQDVMLQTEFAPSPDHQEKIDKEREAGHPRVAHRLERIFTGRAATKALAQLLRKTEEPLPRPIEFTHCEFGRGFLLTRKDTRYYCLLKLFSPDHRHYEKKELEAGFVNVKTGEDLSGKKYPGVILPLAMGREFHEAAYLRQGSPQSAKLVVRRDEQGQYRFFIHVAFRFTPERLPVETILGIDRGAAIIGAASILRMDGTLRETGLNLDGTAFAAEMQRHEQKIREQQKRGIQKKGKRGNRFRLRGLRADAVLGEYANAVIAKAVEHRSQIVIEKINAVTMSGVLKQSQFTKLKTMLTYKAKRQGLPEPMEVPAAYTSQTCSKCGYKDRANRPKKDAEGKTLQNVFLCVQCRHCANADENASIVIALRGLHQVQQGGKFQKWPVFEDWLKTKLGRDSLATGL